MSIFKRPIRVMWAFTILLILFSGCGAMSEVFPEASPLPTTNSPTPSSPTPTTPTTPTDPPASENGMRGVWVSTVLNLDYPSKAGLSKDELMAEAIKILDNSAAMGFNAVFLQVRPSSDALYKSEIYPWSSYLTGEQGLAPDGDFDPLEFWVQEAHSRGLELHAWINPYRVARQNHDLNSLAPDHIARKNPGWVVMHTDGHMYFNPGIPAVRALVIDGVKEIVENYDVDGIHFDDYFYPDPSFNDSDTFKTFGGKYSDIEVWRRDNINILIEDTYIAIKDIDADVSFGVSPFGIWANKSSNRLGSATNGNQSYYSHYADTRGWVKNGWIDYICPQLYWNIGFEIADYEVLLNWWVDVVRGTDVDLYIGHASYRSGADNPSSPWYGTSELRRQLLLNSETPEVKGSIHFRYQFFTSYPALGNFISSYHSDATPEDYPQMDQYNNSGTITVGRPSADMSTSFGNIYVLGSCSPEQPLYLNGTEVENITDEGFFGVDYRLEVGANLLTFTQGENTLTRTITRNTGSSVTEPSTMVRDKAEIIEGTTYPHSYDVYITPGEKITFRCTAPIGSTVNVTLAGVTYKLSPSTTKSPGNDGIYYTAHSYTYAMPKTNVTGRVITIGVPVYTMEYEGMTYTREATAALKCITPSAPFYAKVTSDVANIYPSSKTSGGPSGELELGATDYITAITASGRWVRLGLGHWIMREDVECYDGNTTLKANLSDPVYTIGEKWDTLKFKVSTPTAAVATLSDNVITLKISAPGNVPTLKLPVGSLPDAFSSTSDDTSAIYRLTIGDATKLDGYFLSFYDDSIVLNLKRRPKLADSIKSPLSGIVIMLDAGHGGNDTGAQGPLGNSGYAEKDITLDTVRKLKYELETLGATVLLTRSGDNAVTLDERLSLSRNVKPDLFLSIHNDAVEINRDATSIRGMGTWYSKNYSYDFASALVHYTSGQLGRLNRKTNQTNLYVCRATWTPSVIFETGFICNPGEFAWLTDNSSQTELARAITGAIINYFG